MTAAVTALRAEIALASAAAPSRHAALALAGADPLRLDLPPLPGVRVAPESLHALSALYLAARLEEAGLLQAAEALVRQRAILRVPIQTAVKLDDLAQRQQQFFSTGQRLALFGRLFGTGFAAGSDPAAAATGFEARLAALCSALVACGPAPAGPIDSRRLPVELAGRDLAELAGTVAGNGAALAVPRLTDHLRRAVDLLADPGIGALVSAHGPWETLRALLGAGAPDLRRLIDCGRSGQRLLLWLSGAVRSSQQPAGAAGPIGTDVVASAAAWLTACGLPPRPRGEGSI